LKQYLFSVPVCIIPTLAPAENWFGLSLVQPENVHGRFAAAQLRRRFVIQERNLVMMSLKTIFVRSGSASRIAKCAAIAVIGLYGTMLSASDASALTCVRGVYRAGCISPYGAVGVGPNGLVAVGRYGNVYAYRRGSGCFWRNGQRYCM
jgi:hypothetical protein